MHTNTKTSIKMGIVYGAIMGAFFSFQRGVVIGIIGGVLSGILFGVLMGIFMKYMRKKIELNKPQIVTEKTIVFEGLANHFKGLESVGGWLFLTDEELIFKSHSMNIQNHEWVVSLNEIVDAKAVKTLGLVANGLLVTTKQDTNERFVVNQRNIWVEKISKAKSALVR